jgi:23S rRNA pseudouridine1911/1915/1917 synthase
MPPRDAPAPPPDDPVDDDVVIDDVAPVDPDAPELALALGDGHRSGHLALQAFDERGRPSIIEHRFVVENECEGWRLDRFLMKRIRRLSRARVQRVIRGDLDIDGVRVTRPGQAVHAGQRVAFRRPAPSEPEAPRDIGVLLADPSLYALCKPAGLPIHPTARYHYSTLTAVLRERFPDERLEVCHRLDRETSGILLVARTREAGPLLKRAFARRQVRKRYLAIVHGELEGERLVDAPLGLAGAASSVRVKMAVLPVEDGGLPSRTRFLPLRRYRGCTLVEARPETGRQHQIRVHAAALGHPIVGDKLYPDESRFIEWADNGDSPELLAALELPRHALHASELEFAHPLDGHPVHVTCPLPADLRDFLATR